MGFGMGFGFLGLLIMLLFWVGIILLAVWLVRSVFSNNSNQTSATSQSQKNSDALEILAQRYARGEITREQYDVMKHDLSWPNPSFRLWDPGSIQTGIFYINHLYSEKNI